MKMKSIFLMAVLTAISLPFTSCDDDDEPGDPQGSTTLNMLNEDNGKTALGNSDVYIDRAYNFYGYSCQIGSVGRKAGLGSIPSSVELSGLNTKVAVEPGCGYQMFRNAAIRQFPSGKNALNITADYYNVYVVSQIKKEEDVTGSVVKFALMDVSDDGLPEYNSSIGELRSIGSEIVVDLPSADFEIETDEGYNLIDFQKNGKQLIVKLQEFRYRDNFGIYIRMNNKYTYVYGQVL